MYEKELRVFIEEELKNISQLVSEMEDCKEESRLIRRAKGSILHDFYNSVERIFLIIAKELNGKIITSNHWHKQLLYQMTIAVKDLRPSIISKKLASELDEYLAFRHLFRNIYGFELDSKRLDDLTERFPDVVDKFNKEITIFLNKL